MSSLGQNGWGLGERGEERRGGRGGGGEGNWIKCDAFFFVVEGWEFIGSSESSFEFVLSIRLPRLA